MTEYGYRRVELQEVTGRDHLGLGKARRETFHDSIPMVGQSLVTLATLLWHHTIGSWDGWWFLDTFTWYNFSVMIVSFLFCMASFQTKAWHVIAGAAYVTFLQTSPVDMI